MLDTCVVTREDPDAVPGPIDEDTGQYPPVPRLTIYQGKCRIQVQVDVNANVVETTAGDREWTYLTSTLELPIDPGPDDVGDPANVRPDDVAEMLACPTDDAIVGRLFNLQGEIRKSDSTKRRVRAREVVS